MVLSGGRSYIERFTHLNANFASLYVATIYRLGETQISSGSKFAMHALAKQLSRSDVKTRFLWLPQAITACRLLPPLDELASNPRLETELVDPNRKAWRFVYGAYTRRIGDQATHRYYLRDKEGYLSSMRAREGHFFELRHDAIRGLLVNCSKTLPFAWNGAGPWCFDPGGHSEG